MGSTGSLRRTVFYAATSVVKPGLFEGIRTYSVAARWLKQLCGTFWRLRQHVVCHPYHLLVVFSFSDCAWAVNSVFHWAARGEGVVAALPGSTAFQLHYHQQTVSLLHALALPSIKRVATYKELFCGRSVSGEKASEALLSFLTHRVPVMAMEVLMDGHPLCVGAVHSARLSKMDLHRDICSFCLPTLVQIPSCRRNGAASPGKNHK